jgi:hypothetical protein
MIEHARHLMKEAVNDYGGTIELTPANTLVGDIPLLNGESATIQLVAHPVDKVAHIVQQHEASGEEIPLWLQDTIVHICEQEGRAIPSACTHTQSSQELH